MSFRTAPHHTAHLLFLWQEDMDLWSEWHYTTNDYQSSYDELLDKIDQPLMYVSRLRNIVLETLKNVHKINPSFMQDLFEEKENKYNLRGGILLDLLDPKFVQKDMESIL